ncbi:MAG: hypothetical protein KJN97_10950 [Deltaproteobacteria bacterium]|nr:hypothetical protein [Deltaproteobacteria bacterium]
MTNTLSKRLLMCGTALAIAASGCATGSSSTASPEPLAKMPNAAIPGTAKVYALALPPPGSASGGDTGLGFAASKAKRAKGELPSYAEAMLEPAELGDLTNDEGQQHLSSTKVSDIMKRHVNEIFQGCVLREIKQTRMSRVSIQMVISGKGEVTGATTKPGSKPFQNCVSRKLIAINFPKFSAPRMGAEYTFSFE